MTRQQLNDKLEHLGTLVGIGRREAMTALRTRRQALMAFAIVILGAVGGSLIGGPIPSKYIGISIHDFSWIWSRI